MNPIDEFLNTIERLRGRDGCPWDKEQTHETLRRYLIEEAYEAIDAIDEKDPKALMEELGDVLLQVVLHTQIAKENNEFTFDDLVNHINKKMIQRHPHVFSNVKVKTAEEVMINWEKLKKEEKPQTMEIFDGVPNSLPALLKALKVSKKASKTGFEWSNQEELWNTLEKETKELKEVTNKPKQFFEELGDLLFMLVNIARWYKQDPEDALNKAIKKFVKRFNKVQEKIIVKNMKLSELSPRELNSLWEKVKLEEKR